MNSGPEQLLVQRIWRGEREACAELVHVHHAGVFRWLLHLCGDCHIAEDLTQETFAAGWRRIRTFSGSSSLATWLHRIAYCKFVDWHRRSHRVSGCNDAKAIDGVDAAVPSPADRAIVDEQFLQLQQAVASLSLADREVIALHYFQGLSFRAMAEVLGVPGGTVKWRVSGALERLRQLMDVRSDHEHGRSTITQMARATTAANAAACNSPAP